MSQSKTLILVAAIVALCATMAFSVVSANDEDTGIPQCRVNTASGFHVDLNPLKMTGKGAGETAYTTFDDGFEWRYLINVCGPIDETCNKVSGLYAIQESAYSIGEAECFALSGTADKPEEFIKLEAANPSIENGGAVMTITGGEEIEDGPGKGKLRSTEITFVCDPEADYPELDFIKEDTANGVYKFEMVTMHACDKEGSVGGGFDWAWFIFFPGVLGFILIFALIGFAIYIIAGIIINKKKYDRTGIELIPNVEFWRMLPGLWLDGILFIKAGFSALIGKCTKRGQYQDLESS